MESGYFFIGDVLGFKNIVTNSAHTELDGSVESWVSLVEGAAAFAQLSEKPQLISDTVFAAAPSGVDGLRQLIQFARYLLENGFKNSFLVRGAITFGPYHWGRLTYGKAVISAHEIEMSQDWIGVTCGDIPDADECWGATGLVCYPPPLKEGLIKLHPVVVWSVPDSKDLVSGSTNFPLTVRGEALKWPWRRRLRNTLDFRQYLLTLSTGNANWATFQGATL